MQLALREISRYRVPLMIWVVVTVVAAVAGPFGTHDAMALGPRALYWGAVAGVSIVLSFGARHYAQERGLGGRLAVWGVFILLISGLSHLINLVIFDT